MGGIVVVILIIIVFVVKSVQQKGGSQRSTEQEANYENSRTAGSYRYSGSTGSTKHSGSSSGNGSYKYSGHTSAKANSNTSGASGYGVQKRNVPSEKPEERLRAIRNAAGIDEDDGAILSAAKINSYVTEMDNELDSQEDLMKPVYDMMVTGPDISIPAGRDFIAEATDMLNSFTTKGD